MKKFLNNKYCRLLRLQTLPFYFEIVIGMMLAQYPHILNLDILFVLQLILSFQLVYHSIYIFNDILDIKSDRLDPVKSKRPLAASEIPLRRAIIISLVLTLLGLIYGYFLSPTIFYFEILMIAYNIVYSLILKKIPYVDSLANGVTHSLRLLLGMVVSGGIIFPSIIIIVFLISDIFSIFKRIEEIDRKSLNRTTLKHYKKPYILMNQILIVSLLLVTVFYTQTNLTRTIAILATTAGLLSIILYSGSKRFRLKFNSFFSF